MEGKRFDYSKLKGRITERFESRKAFAKHIGSSESTVSLKLSGQRELKRKDVFLWAEALGIPDWELSEYFFTTEVAK